MELGWNWKELYIYSTPSQLSVDCRSVHFGLAMQFPRFPDPTHKFEFYPNPDKK